MHTSNTIQFWRSGDKRISYCQHLNLYVINHADGKFHTISSTETIMRKKYPQNVAPKRRVNGHAHG